MSTCLSAIPPHPSNPLYTTLRPPTFGFVALLLHLLRFIDRIPLVGNDRVSASAGKFLSAGAAGSSRSSILGRFTKENFDAGRG